MSKKIPAMAADPMEQERPYFKAFNHLLNTGWKEGRTFGSHGTEMTLFHRADKQILLQHDRCDGFEVWFQANSMHIDETLAEVDAFAEGR